MLVRHIKDILANIAVQLLTGSILVGMSETMSQLPGLFVFLFLMAGTQGIIISVVLWRHKSNRIQNYLLAWLVLMFSLSIFFFIPSNIPAYYYHPLYPGVTAGWILGTAGANFLLMYLRACFGLSPRPRLAWLYWLPTAFFMVLVIGRYIMGPGVAADYIAYGWIGLIYVVGMTIFCHYKFRVYGSRGAVTQNSLNTKRYLRLILLFFATYSVVQVTGFTLYHYIPPVVSLYVAVFVKLLTTVGIYAIAYLNVQNAHQVAPVMMALPAEPAEKYKFSSLDEDTAQAIREQLLALVEKEKIYLQRDLKLKDVADKLDTSVHYLSQVLNERIGISFPDFVNKLRIEEATRMLSAGDESKIESLALDTGFNNKVSFNKAFKKFTGLTPSQYKMQVQEAGAMGVGLPNM